MIASDLSKQQALDADPKAIQQINFTGKLDRVANTTMFFILEEAKRNFFWFLTSNCKSVVSKIKHNTKFGFDLI